MHLHPTQGGEKILGVIHRQICKCIPSTPRTYTPRQSKSQFLGHFLLCEEDLELELVVLDRLLKATTKKAVNLVRQKVHPRQNPGYAYEQDYMSGFLKSYSEIKDAAHRKCPA